MVFCRWDVLIKPSPGVQVPQLADALHNLDNLVLTETTTMARVFPNDQLRTCDPPTAIVFFPLHIAPKLALQTVVNICPVVHHQDVGKPGQFIVTFEHKEIAQLLYGLRIPTSQGAITITCGSGEQDAKWETAMSLHSQAPISERRAHLSALAPAIGRLCAANLTTASHTDPALTDAGQPGNEPPPGGQ